MEIVKICSEKRYFCHVSLSYFRGDITQIFRTAPMLIGARGSVVG
jgi:hypothetical protein